MATTITLGTGALAAGAAAAAVAGAVGLGLAGLAALLGSGGGGDQGKKYKSRSHGGQRYGRDVAGSSPNLERTMELIRQEDVTGCGLKLMCELATENPEDLIDEELAILGLVGPALVPGEDLRGLGALGEYRAAKSLGLNQGNCGEAFFMCPLNGTQLMDTVMGYLP